MEANYTLPTNNYTTTPDVLKMKKLEPKHILIAVIFCVFMAFLMIINLLILLQNGN